MHWLVFVVSVIYTLMCVKEKCVLFWSQLSVCPVMSAPQISLSWDIKTINSRQLQDNSDTLLSIICFYSQKWSHHSNTIWDQRGILQCENMQPLPNSVWYLWKLIMYRFFFTVPLFVLVINTPHLYSLKNTHGHRSGVFYCTSFCFSIKLKTVLSSKWV